MAHEVFISYSSPDKEIAEAACAAIEAAGVGCWMAPRNIIGGTDWAPAIIDAIDISKVVVLIFSGASNESPQVVREVQHAVSRRIPIVPFRIENVPLSKSMEYFISVPQWLDAYVLPMDPHLTTLVETVRAHVPADRAAVPDQAPAVPPEAPSPAAPSASTAKPVEPLPAPARQPDSPHARPSGAGSGRATAALPGSAAGVRSGRRGATLAVVALALVAGAAALLRSVLPGSAPVLVDTLSGHPGAVTALAYSPDGVRLASGAGGEIRVRRAETREEERTLAAPGDAVVRSLAFAADGFTLAAGDDRGTVTLWDAQTGTLKRKLKEHTGPVYALAFSSDGEVLVSGSGDRTACVWDLVKGALKETMRGQNGPVTYVGIRGDGTQVEQLAAGGEDPVPIVCSPDGKLIAGGFGNQVRLSDNETMREVATLSGHTGRVLALAFSPSGKALASAGMDRVVRLWNPVRGRERGRLEGHAGDICALAFAPDGKSLASGSEDRSIRVWRIP